MSHEYCVIIAAVVGIASGSGVGFCLGIWKAAKMQALREANQAQYDRVLGTMAQGTKINPVAMPYPGRGKR